MPLSELSKLISISSMTLVMLFVIFKENKVFNSVITSLSVKVMSFFRRFKITTKMFFHNQAMFPNTFVLTSIRVFRRINQDIAIFICPTSSFPVGIIFPSCIDKTMSLFHPKNRFRRRFLSFLHNNIIDLGCPQINDKGGCLAWK